MTVTTRSGIPTEYRSQRFRSRLEARWAAFFDLVGWRWTYEPFDADGWIPDFLVHGGAPLLVEVGPVATETEYREKAAKAIRHRDRATLIVGVAPVYDSVVGGVIPWQFAGLLVNELGGGEAWEAEWSRCLACPAIGVQSDGGLLPCGHGWSPDSEVGDLEALWSEAGNRVQWQP